MYIRWLGSYRPGGSDLASALRFEINRKDEAAGERVSTRGKITPRGTNHGRAKVGIVLRDDAAFRWFRKDCWSERKDGRLWAKEPANKNSDHNEVWFHMAGAVQAIVIINGFAQQRRDVQNAIRKVSYEAHLPVYKLQNGTLSEDRIW